MTCAIRKIIQEKLPRVWNESIMLETEIITCNNPKEIEEKVNAIEEHWKGVIAFLKRKKYITLNKTSTGNETPLGNKSNNGNSAIIWSNMFGSTYNKIEFQEYLRKLGLDTDNVSKGTLYRIFWERE